MSKYRDEYREFQREAFWTIPRFLGLGIFAAVGLWVASILLIPTKILNPNNAITNYEWFHDVSRNQQASVRQLAAHRELVKGNTDPAEVSRLRIEVTGIQASCRELVARYNSRSAQIHRGLFQGTSVPATLDANTCE